MPPVSFEVNLEGRGLPNARRTREPVEPAHIQGQKSSSNRCKRLRLYEGPLGG